MEIFKTQKEREIKMYSVLVSGFSSQTDDEEIKSFLTEQLKSVHNPLSISIEKSGDDKLVHLSLSEQALVQPVIEKVNSLKSSKFKLQAQKEISKTSNVNENRVIVLNGVKIGYDEAYIRQMFSQFGDIEGVTSQNVKNRIIGEPDYNLFFITFLSNESATKTYFEGKKIPEIQQIFNPYFVKTNKFITFYLKDMRDFNSMKRNNKMKMGNIPPPNQPFYSQAMEMNPGFSPFIQQQPMMAPMGMPYQGFPMQMQVPPQAQQYPFNQPPKGPVPMQKQQPQLK